MNKMIKGLLVAGAVLTIASAGAVANSVQAEAAVKVSTSSHTEKINGLIKEKQEVIAKKKVSTDWREQQALGIRLGEIEREIAALKSGVNNGNSVNVNPGNTGNLTIAEQIAALIQEKQDVIAKKKVSTDWREQQALGIRLGEIEREITALKVGNQGSSTSKPNIDDSASKEVKIQELIAQKMDLVAQKKLSRDKNEQKALGKQIDAIEKEIKQLKKNK